MLVLGLTLVSGCRQTDEPNTSGQTLFNGADLNGWDTWLGPRFLPDGGQDTDTTGLNMDPDRVFTVVEEDGEPAIRISGQQFGGISTLSSLSDYHLTLEFKWGTQKWPPRDKAKRDSGLLYHATGAHGADYGYWMRSQEFQIQEGDCGDYWGVAGGGFSIPAKLDVDSVYHYDAAGQAQLFHETSPLGRHCRKHPDAEKPSGEWNKVDLYCHGDTAVHVMNGITIMVLYGSVQGVHLQELIPLAAGKIQLQSEGAEVFYRRLFWNPITYIPADKLK